MRVSARLNAAVAIFLLGILGSGGPAHAAPRTASAAPPHPTAATADTLSGTITGRGGQPVPGVTVSVSIGAFSDAATTDSQGHYSLATDPGPAYIQISGAGPTGVAPAQFYLERYDIVVNGATTLDVALPVVQVSGIVKNADTSPAVNASVVLSTFDFQPTGYSTSNASTLTNGSGVYTVLLLAGDASVIVVPSTDDQPISQGFSARTDTVANFSFVATVALSGTIRGRGGVPVPHALVQVTVGAVFASASTDDNGHYTVNVNSGPAFIQVSGGGPAGVAPGSFYVERQDVQVSGPTTFNLDLHVVQVTGAITSAEGAAVPGAFVSLASSDASTSGRLSSSDSASSDADGIYSAFVLAGTVDATATPPDGSTLLPSRRVFTAADDTDDGSFTLPRSTLISGTVRGFGAVPVPNASVTITVAGETDFTTTDTSGVYSVQIPTGTASLTVAGGGSAGVPGSFVVTRDNVTVTGATTVDFALPAVQVNGIVVDINGVPVPGVLVSTSTNAGAGSDQLSSSSSAVSAADGRFSYLLFAGDGQSGLAPPDASGFAQGLLPAAIAADLSQRLTIQHADIFPPDIVSGPVVVHVGDRSASVAWTTNRPATSTVEFGIGPLSDTSDDAALVIDHMVTLTGLAPATPYSFRVGSSDQAGNGPAFSDVGTFTTLASPGDTTAPVLTAGPSVVFVDNSSALVEWTTDEPATSVVELAGPPATSVDGDPGRFRQVHRVRLTGLSPDTDYSAQVRSTDPDGNDTESSVFTFHTTTTPDTTAPTIVAGPVVVAKTASRIVVSWTTNEPATSGVSFNDGTVYDVTSDASLTRDHLMTLSGLAGSHTYHVVVSSTDANGNGPTLSGAIDVTTDPDTTPPVISNVQVSEITQTTATISFATDELANSTVRYGVTSGAPDGTVANPTLTRSHELGLNGLQAETTYFFVVVSTDVAGNTAQSAEGTFTTQPLFVDLPPTPPGPVTVPASPTRAAIIHISWGASTDDHGVTGYEVRRDGVVLDTVGPTTLFFDDALASEGTHVYEIGALDFGGHTRLSDPATVIIDRTAPTLSLPANIDANAIGATATVVFSATATDNLDTTIVVTCVPPSGAAFPVGVTTVSCSATDTAGNVSAGSFTVTVHDVTGPVVTSFAPSLAVLWPPNHAMVSLSIRATAIDAVDPAPVCTILSISSNEPINGLGDGDMAPDWAFSGLSFQLRAERGGTGSGRTYTINGECRDASGNATAASTVVRVPKGPAK
jgi:hypothetical protein